MSDKFQAKTFLYGGTNAHVLNDTLPSTDSFGDNAGASGIKLAKFLIKNVSNSFMLELMKHLSKKTNQDMCRICFEEKGNHIADGLVICKKCEELYF
jgi:hypothetical protein